MRRPEPTVYEGRYAEQIDDPVGRAVLEDVKRFTLRDSILITASQTVKILKLVAGLSPHVFTTMKGLVMKDWKTTVSGVVKAIFSVLTIFGISTGHVTEALVTACVAGAVEIVQAILTPDKK